MLTRYTKGERHSRVEGNSTIWPIFKKGSRKICKNYRPIALLNTTHKWFFKVLFYMNKDSWDDILETQTGFRGNRSTVEHLFTLLQIVQKKVYQCFGFC